MAASPFGKLSLREAIVDLLGALVPGIMFFFASFITLLWPTRVIVHELIRFDPLTRDGIIFLLEVGRVFRSELTVLFLITCYVIGHLFFRFDPKTPDQKSFDLIQRNFDCDARKNWCVRKEEDGSTDNQFPYRYLREYLEYRGLPHLAKLVPWYGSKPETHKKRTKTFINMLKIRILFFFPDRYAELAKNEAHIRLMSSFWYVLRSLKRVSFVAIGFVLVAVLLSLIINKTFPFEHLLPLVFAIGLLIAILLVQYNVEKFFHYMRVREIIFVLETALTASKEKKVILDDLEIGLEPK